MTREKVVIDNYTGYDEKEIAKQICKIATPGADYSPIKQPIGISGREEDRL